MFGAVVKCLDQFELLESSLYNILHIWGHSPANAGSLCTVFVLVVVDEWCEGVAGGKRDPKFVLFWKEGNQVNSSWSFSFYGQGTISNALNAGYAF